jgi:hypothetical protein
MSTIKNLNLDTFRSLFVYSPIYTWTGESTAGMTG